MTSLNELHDYLSDLKAARKAVLVGGQSYTTKGGRALHRIPIEELNRMIRETETQIAVNNGGICVSPVVFPEPY